MTSARQDPPAGQTGMHDHARARADATVSPAHRALLSGNNDHSAHGQGKVDADGDFDHDVATRSPGGGVTVTKGGS
jgi:hypothetical protein